MYTVTLGIQQTEYFDPLAGKRFALMNRCHNILVSHAVHLMHWLDHDTGYQDMLKAYRLARKACDSRKVKALCREMDAYRKSIGLSETGLQSYIKTWQHMHKTHISSQQAQKEASRVYAGIEKVLFGTGKLLHYRKLDDCRTICGKSPSNGMAFDRKAMAFRWINETFTLKPLDPDNLYLIQALYPAGTGPLPLSYCEIRRLMFPDGWHYYLVLYIKGIPPQKHSVGTGHAGIDPGTSTMAATTGHGCVLRELAPRAKEYAPRLKKLQKAMDRSRRDSNPGNYNPDGTVKRGARHWRKSRRYRQLERQIRSVYRRRAAYIRQSHCILANKILEGGNQVFAEAMDYKALQAKSKTTERKDTAEVVITKSGCRKRICKYRKRKRFGRSLNSRAPSEFLTILAQKAIASGGFYTEVDTRKFLASQYDHTADTYTKAPLGQRHKVIGGYEVQRDLYSSFLIQHTDSTLTHPDRDGCIKDFEQFIIHMSQEIAQLKASGQSMPACFGF